jgi:uncharacterized membrane protein YgcG
MLLHACLSVSSQHLRGHLRQTNRICRLGLAPNCTDVRSGCSEACVSACAGVNANILWCNGLRTANSPARGSIHVTMQCQAAVAVGQQVQMAVAAARHAVVSVAAVNFACCCACWPTALPVSSCIFRGQQDQQQHLLHPSVHNSPCTTVTPAAAAVGGGFGGGGSARSSGGRSGGSAGRSGGGRGGGGSSAASGGGR